MVMILPPSNTRSAVGEAARTPAPGPRERVTPRNPAVHHPKSRRARMSPTTLIGYEEPVRVCAAFNERRGISCLRRQADRSEEESNKEKPGRPHRRAYLEII